MKPYILRYIPMNPHIVRYSYFPSSPRKWSEKNIQLWDQEAEEEEKEKEKKKSKDVGFR